MLQNAPIHYVVGQKWIEIQGIYTSDQLRLIADKIDEAYNKAFIEKNKENKDENNVNKE